MIGFTDLFHANATWWPSYLVVWSDRLVLVEMTVVADEWIVGLAFLLCGFGGMALAMADLLVLWQFGCFEAKVPLLWQLRSGGLNMPKI